MSADFIWAETVSSMPSSQREEVVYHQASSVSLESPLPELCYSNLENAWKLMELVTISNNVGTE